MRHENRRLTEKEIQRVIQRAAEIQESKGAEVAEWGPTPDEVIKIGEDLGMNGDALRVAINEVLEGKTSGTGGFWGGPLTLWSDRTYEGELSEDDWHELLQGLRKTFGKTGKVSEAAGAQEWHGEDGGLDPVHVSARAKNGVTRVGIQSDIHGVAVISGIVGGFPILIAAILFSKLSGLPPLAELAISGGMFGAAGIAWRRLLGWVGARRQQAITETEQLIQRLTERPATRRDRKKLSNSRFGPKPRATQGVRRSSPRGLHR